MRRTARRIWDLEGQVLDLKIAVAKQDIQIEALYEHLKVKIGYRPAKYVAESQEKKNNE